MSESPCCTPSFAREPNWYRRCCGAKHQRGLEQVLAGMPDDLTEPGPTGAYAATVSAFLRVVLENPAR
jgi:hypothetical protein